jgi:hypothetical protein
MAAVAMPVREVDQFAGLLEDSTLRRRPDNRHTAPAPEVEQPLLAQRTERPENGVPVDAEDGAEVTRGRQALPRPSLSVRDRAANLSGHLLVHSDGRVSIELDVEQWY